MVSGRYKIQEQLSQIILIQGLSCGCNQDIGRFCNHLKACLELEYPISRRLLHKAFGRKPQFLTWLLARDLGSLLHELEYPDDVAANSPQREQ